MTNRSVDIFRGKVKVTKEDRRNIALLSRQLDRMNPYDRNNLLRALNIDADSLIPKSEHDFKNAGAEGDTAYALHKYHQQRLITNF